MGSLMCVMSVARSAGGQAAVVPATGAIMVAASDSARGPIAGADIQVDGGRWRGVTDDRGLLRIETVPAGVHLVVARRLGVAPESLSTTVSPGQAAEVRFVLRSTALNLGAVDVRDERIIPARLQGFEERRAENRNGGQFMTRADIDRIMPRQPSDLVRRMQGMRIMDSLGVQLAVSTRGPKVQMIGNRPVPVQCVVRVGVDGSIKEPYFPMNTIVMSDVYGIEVYSGPSTMPPEFGGARRDAGCGLIMIWTRSR